MGTYSLPVRVARVRGAMVPVVAYGVLIERIIYYPWGMHICDYNEKLKRGCVEIARGIKTQIRPGKARCLGDAKAARTRFDPKVSGSNPGTRWLKKGHVFIVTSLPAGNGLRET